ncbi:MAG TPA: RusA family crossover junction endodeoxyribonuclease [Phycisphaerales bacterium]|nr:RusA family crossover junction endodeoxyribonuclease [Phycisphaerales bacterium]
MTPHDHRIEILIPGEPVAQPRAKTQVLTRRDGTVVRSGNGRVATHTYTPGKKIGPWKQVVALKVREQLPRQPWDGPVELDVTFWFERTQELERHKHGAGELLHTVRPDLDNLVKAIKDVMTDEGVWIDDGRVCDTVIRKRYVARGHGPGCRVIARLITDKPGGLYEQA